MGAGLSNDARGWIMSGISGIACILGASIIGIDILVRMVPNSKCRNFRIQDSKSFLAACFSVSFGVMIFSSLIDIFPSSINYFKKANWSGKLPMGVALGCAAGGFLAIQVFQRVAHHYMPSHVVDCDHSHDASQPHSRSHSRRSSHAAKSRLGRNGNSSEATPLLNGDGDVGKACSKPFHEPSSRGDGLEGHVPESRRPSIRQMPSRVLSFVKDTKGNCDEGGPCYGYSDPCGQECFKHGGPNISNVSRHSRLSRSTTAKSLHQQAMAVSAVPEEDCARVDEESVNRGGSAWTSRTRSGEDDERACDSDDEDLEAQHHHHVPQNAFLDLGLQTTLAIGLHKLPEGFITYATNHANPRLGVAVFSALLVHNLTEGFALALPLYLALQSRPRAMFWSCIAGGLSQPAGAAIAWLWFRLAGTAEHAPGYVAYGVMFAATAGVMTSVAFMLFIEGLAMNHNQNLCIFAALFGMGIMGISSLLKE